MTRIARILVLLGLCSAVVAAAALPAQARFSDVAAVTTTVGTATVAAPGNVSTAGSFCNNGTLHANVTWTLSTSSKVSGYTVTAHYRTGFTRVIAEIGATVTGVGGVVPNQGSSTATAITVTTKTGYGWSTVSPKVPVPPC